jgi:hypothetical protein
MMPGGDVVWELADVQPVLRCVEFVSDKSAATLAAPNVSGWVKESQPDDCARSNRRGGQ